MSASPKSKRESPASKFEDYIATYSTKESLFPISSQIMSYMSQDPGFMVGFGGPSIPGVKGQEVTDIGFSFTFDNRTYEKISISTKGFAILVDSSDPNNFYNTTLDEDDDNWAVRTSVWSAPHVILAPWWDDAVTNVLRSLDDASAPSYLSNLGLNNNSIINGKSTTPPGIDPSLGGVKKFNGIDPRLGKYLVVRWKSFAYSTVSPHNIVNFDLVLYESGSLEFRYAPRIFNSYTSFEHATMAIFANGGSNYGNRYRDFSCFASKSADSRGIYVNGGAVYDGSYTDTADATQSYTISLNTRDNWPGLNSGAVIRFSPPQNKRRQNRSITTIRDSVSFTNRDGSSLFNDQLALPPASSQLVEYPSMMPVSFRTSANYSDPVAINNLYSSGSIQVNRTFKPGLVDSILYDSLIEGRYRRK